MENKRMPLIQIIGLSGSQRGALLKKDLANQNFGFTSNLGVIVNSCDYSNEAFHSSIVSNLILKRQITVGELGCALAHKEACERLINSLSDYSYSIIFEDDANLINKIDPEFFGSILMDPNPRILLLGWNPKFTLVSHGDDLTKSEFVRVVVPPTGTFAYALNLKAARLIAETSKVFTATSDWPIETYSKIQFFALSAPIVDWERAAGDSEIDRLDPRTNHEIANTLHRAIVIVKSIIGLFAIKLFQRRNLSSRQILGCVIMRDLAFSLAKPTPTSSHFYVLPKNFQSLARFFRVIT